MGREGVLSSLDRPVRTCIGCRRRDTQRRLVRFTVVDAAVVVDTSRTRPGRGAYLCWRRECAQQVLGDGRRLARALRAGHDSVTVDTGTLLQDWEANRRQARDGNGKTTKQEGNGRRAADHGVIASGDNT
ncbi:MAG TPA: DUF448 domain-containing protein [Euzebyales bacterium]|nr:DUF448 domain-containing protein [Euzebyales bacterium]